MSVGDYVHLAANYRYGTAANALVNRVAALALEVEGPVQLAVEDHPRTDYVPRRPLGREDRACSHLGRGAILTAEDGLAVRASQVNEFPGKEDATGFAVASTRSDRVRTAASTDDSVVMNVLSNDWCSHVNCADRTARLLIHRTGMGGPDPPRIFRKMTTWPRIEKQIRQVQQQNQKNVRNSYFYCLIQISAHFQWGVY